MIEPWYLLGQDKTLHHVIQATELEQSKYPAIMSGKHFIQMEGADWCSDYFCRNQVMKWLMNI